MLSKQQLLTIQHLKDHRNFTEPKQFIEWAALALQKPWAIEEYRDESGAKHVIFHKRSDSRKHRSVKYYEEIINYFAQGNPVPNARRDV